MNTARQIITPMPEEKTKVMVIEHKKETLGEMLNTFKNILLDPAGVKWISGLVLLSIPPFLENLHGLAAVAATICSAIGGLALIAVSCWQKVHLTRRHNAAERRKAAEYLKKKEIMLKVEQGAMKPEMADWMLKHLDD